MTRKIATLVAPFALLATAALAQPPTTPGGGQPGGPGPRGADRIFQLLDADADGRITREEAMGFVAARFAQADTDRDGALSLAEFQAVRMERGPGGDQPRDPGRAAERRAAMFRALDANSDGRLTLDEVRPAAEARFRAADANSDGVVTREEAGQRHAHRGGPPGPR